MNSLSTLALKAPAIQVLELSFCNGVWFVPLGAFPSLEECVIEECKGLELVHAEDCAELARLRITRRSGACRGSPPWS